MQRLLRRFGSKRLPVIVAVGLLAACEESGRPDDKSRPIQSHEIARVVSAQEALSGAHIPTLDPATMREAEISKLIGDGPRCEFRYTTAGRAVLAMSTEAGGAAGQAVAKVNGKLVALAPAQAGEGGVNAGRINLTADPIRLTVMPDQERQSEPLEGVLRREAAMIFQIGDSLKVGYRGYVDCAPKPTRISHRR
jgi:hypothetical protein